MLRNFDLNTKKIEIMHVFQKSLYAEEETGKMYTRMREVNFVSLRKMNSEVPRIIVAM